MSDEQRKNTIQSALSAAKSYSEKFTVRIIDGIYTYERWKAGHAYYDSSIYAIVHPNGSIEKK